MLTSADGDTAAVEDTVHKPSFKKQELDADNHFCISWSILNVQHHEHQSKAISRQLTGH